jgi:peroxiredoxin
MQSKFLESDFFSNKRVLLLGINRIQSHPTIKQVKDFDRLHEQIKSCGIDEIHFISICDFLLFDPMMIKLAPHSRATQLTDPADITALQNMLGKKGHHKFLKDYWQFVAVVNNQQVEYYQDQPFDSKFGPDTRVNIYSNLWPEKILDWLTQNKI